MSRARETNTVHVVADDLDQAVEDLTREWSADRRARWAIDSGTPATHPLDVERHRCAPDNVREALRIARLEAQRQAIEAAIPPDRAAELRAVEIRVASLHRARQDLVAGRGRYAGTPEGEAALALSTARARRQEAERLAEAADSRRQRRQCRRSAEGWVDREAKAAAAYDDIAAPEAKRLDRQINAMNIRAKEVREYQHDRAAWLRERPGATAELNAVEQELNPLRDMPETHQLLSRLLTPRNEPEIQTGVGHEADLGFDIGF